MITKLESRCFKPAPLAFVITLALAGVTPSLHARDYFNPALLSVDNPGMEGTDLSVFEEGNQAPGVYRVDVIVNDQVMETRDIDFKLATETGNKETLQPCLTLEMLESWGVKTSFFPQLSSGKEGECANLSAIPMASAKFDFANLRLSLSIPMAALNQSVRGYVPPEQWDEGINALMLNYSFSGDNTWSRNSQTDDSNSQYANLRPGLNIGPWRLRNYTTWSRDNSGNNKWNTVYTYAQRDVVALKSQFVAGDSTSPSDIFDSVPFRGAQLSSDDEMLPNSQRGYAPIVRGIARTNAQVVIRQNGYTIYQSYVPAGAFEINDLYPTGGSGDLIVTIKEADGSEQNIVVPYASVPVLQREGRLKYSLTGGQYRSYDSSVDKTPFAQLTAIYGLASGTTIYGGMQESSRYQSLAFGVGQNLGRIGAFSVDATQSWGTPNGEDKQSGQSWRVRYGKNFVDTGTNFAIAGYRYSTDGYYTMNEVLNSYSRVPGTIERRRNRAELTVSQSLGQGFGSLTASAVRQDYWNSVRASESYSVGYTNSFKGVSYGLSYTHARNTMGTGSERGKIYDRDDLFALNISVPLSNFMPSTWVSYNMNSSKRGNTTHSVSLSGSSLENNALSWSVQEGYGTKGVGNTGSLNAVYTGTYGQVSGGYGYDRGGQRLNYGLSGGVVAHADGVTLSQPLGDTVALVKAPGAAGINVLNQSGAKTDFRGYSVVGNVTPYRRNDINLDTQSLPDDVEMEMTTQTVIPTRGAIVRANYKANVGLRVLMTLTRANGQPVPFGALATIPGSDTKQSFIVGDNGQVYLSGLAQQGTLNVQWGKDAGESCVVNYNITSNSDIPGVLSASAQCN